MGFQVFNAKKAALNITFDMIIEAVLILIVAFFFINYVDSISNNTLFERTFLAKDLALITNTLQAAPQDAVVSYEPKYGGPAYKLYTDTIFQRNLDLSKYSYDFGDNFVKLQLEKYDEEQFRLVPDKLLVSYPIHYNNNLARYYPLLERPSRIVLANTNNVFTVDSQGIVASSQDTSPKSVISSSAGEITLVKIDCGNEKSTFPINQILLDADSGYYITQNSKPELQKGVMNLAQDQIEMDIIWEFMKSLEISLKSTEKGYVVTTSRTKKTPDEKFTYEARLNKVTPATDLILVLKNYYTESHSDNTIKIYYPINNKESKKLACYIHNAIIDTAEQLNQHDANDIQQPIMTELVDEKTKQLLEKNNKLGLQIEFGNIAVPSNKLFSLRIPLAKAIKTAIRQHNDHYADEDEDKGQSP
ncbi:hypothetical protein HYY69_07875 [Candidatus Woesearchaeota archaeon]|nr:hypothetical protein [Candidatus Woesearchaeota archaeon]